MRRVYIVIIAVIIILGIVGSIFLYQNWKKEEDDWPGEFEDDNREVYIYQDVSESYWASEYISYVVQRDIMTVDDENHFYPESNMSLKNFLITVFRGIMPRVTMSQWSDEELLSFLQERKILDEDVSVAKLNSSLTNYEAAILLAKIDIKIRENNQIMKEIDDIDLAEIDDVGRTLIGHSIASGYFNMKNAKNFYLSKVLTRAEIAEIVYMFLTRQEG